MSEQAVIYVAIAPKDKLEAGLAEKVAPIIKKNVHETRLVLGGKIPRIVGRYQTFPTAESVAQQLISQGLVAIVCRESELRQSPSAMFRAHALQMGEGEITFWDKGRQARVVDAKDVFMILKGTLRSHVVRETTTTKPKLDVAATMLAAGVPVVRNVDVETKEESIETESFIRIYDRTSPEPVVEVLQRNFDYSGLGKKKAFSSLANLNALVTELRSRFPKAVFDDRLTAHFKVDLPFATAEDEVEINCRLIYLLQQALKKSGPPA